MERLENPDEALIAAMAEKPVRDLAREEGVDDATKEVFDLRAEQRGEAALKAYKDKQESINGLVNPELHQFKENLKQVTEKLKEEFGGTFQGEVYTPELRAAKYESGKLKVIEIKNLIGEFERGKYEAIGQLGKKLEGPAVANQSLKPELRSQKYILEAYENDPEAKELIDRFVALTREQYAQNSNIEKLMRQKKESYGSAENMNSFLERVGITKKIPTELSKDSIYEALRSKDTKKVDSLASKLVWAFSIFDGFQVSKDKIEDLKPDLDYIGEALNSMANDLRYSSAVYSEEDKAKFVTLLGSSETGKKYIKNERPLIYTVES